VLLLVAARHVAHDEETRGARARAAGGRGNGARAVCGLPGGGGRAARGGAARRGSDPSTPTQRARAVTAGSCSRPRPPASQACPTYLELGTEADSPRGRIHLMRALEERRLEPSAEVIRHLDLCLGCRACETACPSGVQYGALIEAARPWIERHRPAPARLARRLLAHALTTRWLRAAIFAPVRFLPGGWASRGWLAYAAALPRRQRAALPAVLEPGRPGRGRRAAPRVPPHAPCPGDAAATGRCPRPRAA